MSRKTRNFMQLKDGYGRERNRAYSTVCTAASGV